MKTATNNSISVPAPEFFDLSNFPKGESKILKWPWTVEWEFFSNRDWGNSELPLISIVTPSFNQGKYIEETIRSVLLQGYPKLEFIIIDGGSSDESLEVIKKYSKWITHWISEPDNGQSHAINKGWASCHGQIISYLNSDDILCPGALMIVAEVFLKNSDVGAIYGDCDLIDGRSELVQSMKSIKYDRASLLLGDYIHQSSAFFSHEVVKRIGMVDETYHMCMDYDIFVRIAMAGYQMHYEDKLLSCARLVTGTKTKSQTLKFLPDGLRILDKVYGTVNLPPDVSKVRREAYGNMWRLGGIRLFDAGDRRNAVLAMLAALRYDPFTHWKNILICLLVVFQSLIGIHRWSPNTMEKKI